jgi:hypothetical protein
MEKKFLRIVTALTLLSAVNASAWTNSQDAGNMLGATQVKEITFEKNKGILTDVQKIELRTAINEAAQIGKIAEVKILAWSDKEYPSPTGKQSRDDVKLAQKRLKDIKSYLKDLKVSEVGTYNMTERPNALQKLFHTSTEKVKKTAEMAGAAPTADQTGLFDNKAQASKSIVMIFITK